MGLRSIMLLGNTQDKMADVGEPIKADGWYGRGDHLYTVAFHVAKFQGTVFIEGALVAEPTDGDWFDLITPVEFGDGDVSGFKEGETLAYGVTFKANVAWIRARMDRPGFPDPSTSGINLNIANIVPTLWGFVDRIMINA